MGVPLTATHDAAMDRRTRTTRSPKMKRLSLNTLLLPAVVAAGLMSTPAFAHIDMTYPPARYSPASEATIKYCPCGAAGPGTGGNRVCGNPTATDPNRANDRVTTLLPGSTVVFQFSEYINHSGRYRVAFDPDGADMADFNANILLDVPDDAVTNVGSGTLWELEVKLPNMECTNCTLQLVQAMHGDTVNLVPDPSGLSSYYQCADIILTADAPASDTGTADDTGSVATSGGEPSTEGGASAADGNDTGGAVTTGGTEPGGTEETGGRRRRGGGGGNNDDDDESEGSSGGLPAAAPAPVGCQVSRDASRNGSALAMLGMFFVGWRRRRATLSSNLR